MPMSQRGKDTFLLWAFIPQILLGWLEVTQLVLISWPLCQALS